MELFRSTLLNYTGTDEQRIDNKLKLVHFDNANEFEKFSGNRAITGLFSETWGIPLAISLRNQDVNSRSDNIYHEYVHYFMNEKSNAVYPLWYKEGFAEMLSSADFGRESAFVGGLPKARDYSFNRWGAYRIMQVDTLLSPDMENDSPIYWHRFYSSSWFLTHYLTFGYLAGKPDYRNRFHNYLLSYAKGDRSPEAFFAQLKISAKELQKELMKYRRERLHGFNIKIKPYGKKINYRALEDNEANFMLAEVATELGNNQLAVNYLKNLDGGKSGWRRMAALLSVLVMDKEDVGKTAKFMEQIESKDVDDYLLNTLFSRYYLNRMVVAKESGTDFDLLYRKSVFFSRKSIKENPSYIPAYRNLWLAYAENGETVKSVQTMLAVLNKFPHNFNVNAEIGFYLAEQERYDLARPYLSNVVAWSHAGSLRDKAQGFLKAATDSNSKILADKSEN